MIAGRMLGFTGAVLLLSGCPGPAPVGFEQLAAGLANAQCEAATRCGGGFDVLEQTTREQVTDCPAQVAAFLEVTAVGQYRSAIAAGTIAYDANAAATCLAAYHGTSCSPTPSGAPDPSCLQVFHGTLANGAPCSNTEECSDLSECDSSHMGMCPSGVCVHVPQSGEACTGHCAQGFQCTDARICAPLAAAGAACSPGGCVSGLACMTTAADPAHGTCAAATLPGEGQPCEFGCDTGLICSQSTHLCRRPRTDGTCESTFYGIDDCASGQQCVVAPGTGAGTCQPLPTAGQPCQTICARGSRCTPVSMSSSMCVAPAANGAPCETSTQCASLFCTAGACAPAPFCRPS